MNKSGEILLVRGAVRSADQAQQLAEYLERTRTPYVNMTTLSGVQQVQLQVRVAEVSRAAVKALGINAFYAGSKAFFTGQRVGSSNWRRHRALNRHRAPPAARMSPNH